MTDFEQAFIRERERIRKTRSHAILKEQSEPSYVGTAQSNDDAIDAAARRLAARDAYIHSVRK